MDFEIWNKIEGYDNYTVSNLGRVYNIKLKRIKAQRMAPTGYLIADLKQNGVKRTHYVHRLVAEAFISNPENKPCVNHKNEVRTDNECSNLEWCTVAYNNSYNGRAKRVGEHHQKHHPSRKRVRNVDTGEIYSSVRAAGRATGVCSISISYCLNGKQKHAGNYRWEVVLSE